jgi:pilus assembly protein CpaF
VFAIVISEKGGAERREVFDRSEISVGRVQGNDLMLPKGNVSKRHARLLFRDGRFIVTDLNSTNGTYVNRRRISQATIVREGDRIYVGDFVLRIEVPEELGDAASPAEATGSGPVLASRESQEKFVSAQPLEADESGGSYPQVPGPPRVPGAARLPSATVEPPPGTDSRPGSLASIPDASQPAIEVPSVSTPDVDIPEDAGVYGTALATLVERVIEQLPSAALDGDIDDALTARVERAIPEQLAALDKEGEIPRDAARESLARDARLELLELGPLGPLLDEVGVSAINVARFDRVTVVRNGRSGRVHPTFSSEASLRRVVARLCRRAGEPLAADKRAVECRLPNGAKASAVMGPAAVSGTVLLVQKPRRVALSIDDLVRSGTISRAMATFLSHCVAARSNILVVGPRDAGTSSVLSALSAAGEGPIVSVQELDDVVAHDPAATRFSLGDSGAESRNLVQLAARMPDSRLVIELRDSDVTGAVVETIGEGADGVVAALRAPSLRRAMARLPGDLAVARQGMSIAAAREWVASSFDIAIEVSRLRDGRHRVLRVVELQGVEGDEIKLQDIFTFVVERTAAGGAVEGTFNPSGVVPRIVEELNARGVPLETSLFTRPPSR